MQRIIRTTKETIVIFSNGNSVSKNLDDKEFEHLCSLEDEQEIMNYMTLGENKVAELASIKETVDNSKKSKYLIFKNNCIYWEEVSMLSLPQDLAEDILKAELNNNIIKIETYKNFWTLMSLNTDAECRKNLYWFLKKYGMTLARCGFFVGYRNVDTTEEEGVYTDHHSHKFKIKIGEMVTMPREDCDNDSGVSCSRGLHIGGKGWLKRNYYGNVGLACLVNPAEVVAVPHIDNYGKLRTCAYLPIDIINYDEYDEVIPLNVEDGFDCSYINKVIYEGIMGTEEDSPYKINIPDVPEINRQSITDRLLDIALGVICDRKLV